MSIFCISRAITQNSYLILVNFSILNILISLCSVIIFICVSSRCRDDINLEGHRRPWVCSLWTSTAGEKLDQTVQTCLEELLMWKDSLYICSLPFFFFLITGELSECHQVFLWTTGGHQAVYVELETNALFLCCVCVIFTVSSQRSDRTLRRRTPMTPWRFIRCRYSVGLFPDYYFFIP